MPPFLLDENVAVPIARLLRAEGRDAEHCRERGMNKVFDFRILAVAAAEGRALLANDRDFILLHGAWRYWSDLWNVPAHHAGILLLDQHTASEVMVRAILAFENTTLPLPDHIYEWTKNNGWRVPKGLE